MNIKRLLILSILSIIVLVNPVYAEDDSSDINKWAFVKLTKASDQDENVVVSKFYYLNDMNQVGFCIEPSQKFDPSVGDYERNYSNNENIYNIVKAYKTLNKTENEYYIAAQLLIWNEVAGVEYTFKGNDYQEYKDEILNIMYPKKLLMKSLSSEELPESYVGEENIIEGDYTEYDTEAKGIDIISNDENGLKYVIEDEEPEIKTINLTPKDSDENHSYVLESSESQDIYYFEGEYSTLKPFSLSLKTLMRPSTVTINFSKKDENGNNIAGAEFSVYELNVSETNDEIIFIQNGVSINVYEAILDNFDSYNNLSIHISERYEKYLDGDYIKTGEVGYFPYEIYESESLIKQGIVYVTDDISQSNGKYAKNAVRAIFKAYSEDLDINSISNLERNKTYYLCESEPKKGYTYTQNPCVLVDTATYNGETYSFINKTRTYSLRLIKQSDHNILLDGAKFKITYDNYGVDESIILTTGNLCITRENSSKYLIYRHEFDSDASVVGFESNEYIKSGLKTGKYYYYQSNSSIVNNSLLNDNYQIVVNGGLEIENLPYSSSLTIEELVAPKGYIITEPVYHISPDIPYSEITFKNYRVNYLDIIPSKFKIPKTCIDE